MSYRASSDLPSIRTPYKRNIRNKRNTIADHRISASRSAINGDCALRR
jgi:hypothetical protein